MLINCKSRRSRYPHGCARTSCWRYLCCRPLILVLPLSHSEGLGNCFIKKGKSSKSRIVQLSNVLDNLSKNLDRDVRLCNFLRSLIGLHSLTGCDTVAAFAGKRQIQGAATCAQQYIMCQSIIGNRRQFGPYRGNHGSC